MAEAEILADMQAAMKLLETREPRRVPFPRELSFREAMELLVESAGVIHLRVHPYVTPRCVTFVSPGLMLIPSWAEFLAGLRGAAWHDDMWNCPTWASENPTDAAACRCTSEGV